jgi:GT2 family glycosyltransferase
MAISDELSKQTSIIVCTVDRLKELDECLKSLGAFTLGGAEIIVVNNGPNVAEVAEIAKRHNARAVNEPKHGVSHARNAGIREAAGKILTFLDDDSVAAPEWLTCLLAPLVEPQVLAVIGSIFPQALNDPASQALDHVHRAQFPKLRTVFDGNDGSSPFPMRAALVGNANMAIRRMVFERFGYFDTRLGRGTRIGSGEEPDLLLRILLGGGKIVAEPRARILHRHSSAWTDVRRWAFRSGCAHTAILLKYFLQQPSLRGRIIDYAASRLRRRPRHEASASARLKVPRISLLGGSLWGPFAFLLSGKE